MHAATFHPSRSSLAPDGAIIRLRLGARRVNKWGKGLLCYITIITLCYTTLHYATLHLIYIALYYIHRHTQTNSFSLYLLYPPTDRPILLPSCLPTCLPTYLPYLPNRPYLDRRYHTLPYATYLTYLTYLADLSYLACLTCLTCLTYLTYQVPNHQSTCLFKLPNLPSHPPTCLPASIHMCGLCVYAGTSPCHVLQCLLFSPRHVNVILTSAANTAFFDAFRDFRLVQLDRPMKKNS